MQTTPTHTPIGAKIISTPRRRAEQDAQAVRRAIAIRDALERSIETRQSKIAIRQPVKSEAGMTKSETRAAYMRRAELVIACVVALEAIAHRRHREASDAWFEAVQKLPKRRKITVRDIKRVVCAHFRVREADIASERRSRNLVMPRQIAMYLTRELTDASFPTIGRAYGNRDHTTVLHGWRKVTAMLEADDALAAHVASLKQALELEVKS